MVYYERVSGNLWSGKWMQYTIW